MKRIWIITLFLVLSMLLACTRAEGLFSLLQTPTPEPMETPAPVVTLPPAGARVDSGESASGLFDQLETASPEAAALDPTATPEPAAADSDESTTGADVSCFQGLSYTDMNATEPTRIVNIEGEDTTDYIYEQVSEDDLRRYRTYLEDKGCDFMALQTDSENAITLAVYSTALDFGFMLIYESDKALLELKFIPYEPEAEPETETAADSESTTGADVSCFQGLSYTDMNGTEPTRIMSIEDVNNTDYIYEQVSEDDFKNYRAYLKDSGCLSYNVGSDSENVICLGIYSTGLDFGFVLAYDYDKTILELVYHSNELEAEPAAEAAPDTGVSALSAEAATPSVCPHCNKGHCITCYGRGVVKCDNCGGLGRCPDCRGKREFHGIGWGGVGTAIYTTCDTCGGSGRCNYCDGYGRVECGDCNRGICLYCGGNYLSY